MKILSDSAAERAVLAGMCEYGGDAYLDICDMVKVGTFTLPTNQCLWKCIELICKGNNDAKVDLPSILSASTSLGLSHIIEKTEEAKHLHSILQLHVDRSNVGKFATKLRKLEVARLVYKQGGILQERMAEIEGTEAVSFILGLAEDIIFDFTSLLDDGGNNPAKLGTGIKEYLDYLAANPVQQLGVSTGFKEWDKAIGGGLRPGTLNVIGARPKTGKTILSDNMGYNISKQEDRLPVLNMDTEMLREDHLNRTMAMISGVKIHDIETGQFGQYPDKSIKVYEAGQLLEKAPYYHRSIAGMPFEDQLALMRRWLQREVGLNSDGTAKPCVIIYDYLKLMDANGVSDALREFQLLGFMMSTLHNFAVRYKVPFIILMQLNRDALQREGTDVASGSDRIIWLCSNFTIFKDKSPEEIAEDGPDAGNRKLVVLACRHGGGSDFGDYINCHMEGWRARIREGRRKLDPRQEGEIGNGEDEFHVDGDEVEDGEAIDDGIPFE